MEHLLRLLLSLKSWSLLKLSLSVTQVGEWELCRAEVTPCGSWTCCGDTGGDTRGERCDPDMEVQGMLQLGEFSLAQQGAGREPQL